MGWRIQISFIASIAPLDGTVTSYKFNTVYCIQMNTADLLFMFLSHTIVSLLMKGKKDKVVTQFYNFKWLFSPLFNLLSQSSSRYCLWHRAHISLFKYCSLLIHSFTLYFSYSVTMVQKHFGSATKINLKKEKLPSN